LSGERLTASLPLPKDSTVSYIKSGSIRIINITHSPEVALPGVPTRDLGRDTGHSRCPLCHSGVTVIDIRRARAIAIAANSTANSQLDAGECVGMLPAIAQLEVRSRPPISGFESKIGGASRSRPRSQLKAKVGDCKRPLEGSKAWLQ
jgi:hypothetical protein